MPQRVGGRAVTYQATISARRSSSSPPLPLQLLFPFPYQLAANSIRSNLRLAINHLSGPQGQRLRDARRDSPRLVSLQCPKDNTPR